MTRSVFVAQIVLANHHAIEIICTSKEDRARLVSTIPTETIAALEMLEGDPQTVAPPREIVVAGPGPEDDECPCPACLLARLLQRDTPPTAH